MDGKKNQSKKKCRPRKKNRSEKKKSAEKLKFSIEKINSAAEKKKNLLIQRKSHGRKINKISFNRREWYQINRQTYRFCLLR